MVALSAGEVILVPFPFSDLSQNKVRPAVCLANAGRGDWIMCQVTSSPYGDPTAVSMSQSDFAVGGLLIQSYARPGRLFTASATIVVRSVGQLTHVALQRAIDAVVDVLGKPSGP